jgi:TPR repeat protein
MLFVNAETESQYRFALKYAKRIYKSNTAELMHFCGRFYYDVDNPLFDLTLANDAWTRAAGEGHPHAPWMLALRHKNGEFGKRVDLERYQHYRDMAFERGNAGAYAYKFADALHEYDRLDEAEKKIATNLKSVIDDGFKEIPGLPTLWIIGCCYANGEYVSQNMTLAYKAFALLRSREIPVGPCISGSIACALFDFFGIGTEKNLETAAERVSWIPTAKGLHRGGLEAESGADRIRLAVAKESSETNATADIRAIRLHLNILWEKQPDDLGSFDRRSYSPPLQEGDQRLMWYLELLLSLAKTIGSPNWFYLRRVMAAHQITFLRSDFATLERSTQRKGHRFNDEHSLLPVVGTTCTSLNEGFSQIDAIVLDSNNLAILGDWQRGPAARLSWQDVLDAMTFAYGFNEPVWPRLSLEPIQAHLPQNLSWQIKQKVFTPAWFGNTEAGLTFYQCDWLLGNIFNILDCDIVSSDAKQNQAHLKLARELSINLRLLGGLEVGSWSRVMLKPEALKILIKREPNHSVHCLIDTINTRIDGAACIDISETSSNRSIRQNDDQFAAGRLANYLTDHYDDLRILFPAFDRLQQLYRIIGLFGTMRRQNVQLPADWAAIATRRAHSFRNNGGVKDEEKYCM